MDTKAAKSLWIMKIEKELKMPYIQLDLSGSYPADAKKIGGF